MFGVLATWQMAPAYLAAVPLLWLAFRRGGSRRWRRGALVLGAVLSLASLLAFYLFPFFTLPPPAGPFAVGTFALHLVDTSRSEMHTANPVDKRELMVRVWYPAKADATKKPEPYWHDASLYAAAFNQSMWPVGYFLGHLGKIPTHSYADLAATPGPHPVLLFSHGLGAGFSGQNRALVEDLASRGYVVVGIDHAYDGLLTIFPDGRIAQFMPDAYEAHDPEPPAALTEEAKRTVNSWDADEQIRLSRKLLAAMPREAELSRFWNDVWSRDQRFVLDQVQRLQDGSIPSTLNGQLDLDRVGVFGMSFGGGAAATTCALDPRCKAGINMDGFRAMSIETPPQHAPFLYFASQHVNMNVLFLERDLGPRYFVKVDGAEHFDFADFPLYSRLFKPLQASGPIASQRILAITDAYVVAFFDKYLRGRAAPLLDGPPAQYPEVRFLARTPTP